LNYIYSNFKIFGFKGAFVTIPLIIKLTFIFKTGLKFFINPTKITFASKIDICCPRQFLGPAENGVKTYGENVYFLSPIIINKKFI